METKSAYTLDRAKIAQVAGHLTRLLGTVDSPRQRLAQSGSRVVARNAFLGEPLAFRTRTATHGKRKLVVLFDQSGSMNREWHKHGAYFAAALQTLAQRGVLDATLILTGGGQCARVPRTFKPEYFGRFGCNEGCESVDRTLKQYKPLLVEADTVLIYTDGHLTDGRVDAGHYRSIGVDLIGVAVTEDYARATVTTALQKHFARGITALSGAELATAIAQYITNH